MKSAWTTKCSAQERNYVFSICIYVSMLCTTYLCTYVSFSTVVIRRTTTKSAQASQTCETIAEQAMLQMVKYSVVWELTISTLTLFNHSGPFSHSLLNFRKFAQRLRFDILRQNSLVLYPLVRTTMNNQ